MIAKSYQWQKNENHLENALLSTSVQTRLVFALIANHLIEIVQILLILRCLLFVIGLAKLKMSILIGVKHLTKSK